MKPTKYLLLLAIAASVNCSSASRTTIDVDSGTANATNAAPTTTPSDAAAVDGKAAKSSVAPDAVIKDLYATHDKDNGKILDGKSRVTLDKFYDKTLADMIWRDLTANRDTVGAIDFDILYNAQDSQIAILAVGEPKIDGGKATVPVTVENHGRKESLVYSMVETGGAWKIADINYGGGDTLVKYFKEDAAARKNESSASPSGEFEGKYQVGDTTCTVTPAKMSFEVRWAKGSGVETFYADTNDDGRITFSSSNPSGKGTPNSFAFDDENYNTGTFYRADGKEFAVKRMK